MGGVGRGAIRSTTIQFGWRRHGPLLKWEKAAWRRQHGWRRVSSSDGAPRPPQTSNSRPHPALLTRTDICISHSQVARHSPLTPRRPLYGARLQGHGSRTSGHHTHYSGGAPSLRRADVRWRFGRVHVRVGACRKGPARQPRGRPSWRQRVGRWMDVRRVCRAAVAAHRVAAARPNSCGARGCRHPRRHARV